jgi:hypothetical protein
MYCLKWKITASNNGVCKGFIFKIYVRLNKFVSLSGRLDHCQRRSLYLVLCEISAEVEEITDVMLKKELSIENRINNMPLAAIELSWSD